MEREVMKHDLLNVIGKTTLVDEANNLGHVACGATGEDNVALQRIARLILRGCGLIIVGVAAKATPTKAAPERRARIPRNKQTRCESAMTAICQELMTALCRCDTTAWGP